MNKYDVRLKSLENEQIRVSLDHWNGSRGTSMPIGDYADVAQAHTVAAFVQQALHDRYMDGLTEAFDTAIARIEGMRK